MATETKTKKAPGLERIENNIYFSSLNGGIYETSKNEVEPDAKNINGSTSGKPWARWGTDDKYPQRLIDAVKADPIASLIEKKIAFHWGKGIMFYRKETDAEGNEKISVVPEEKLPEEIRAFLKTNRWNKFMLSIITDCEWWHSFCVQYIEDLNDKIVKVKWQRRKDVRPEIRDPKNGKINNYYLSPFFGNGAEVGKNVAVIPAYDPFEPGSGIYNHDLPSVDKDYNPDPAWHGISRWLHIAAKIPRWILANIDNSMNIKYHVKIPYQYWVKRNPIELYANEAEQKAGIEKDIAATYQAMDEYLAGETNVHKAFYSHVAVDDDGKALPGWELLTIENNTEHEAWLRAYGTAAMAMISGIGLSPSIAGTILPNGLGSGSGSDLREQFNFYIQVMTAIPRMNTLEPWEFIKERNGWDPSLHMGFKDVILQSLDQNKSGFAQTKEQSPTSDKEEKDLMKV